MTSSATPHGRRALRRLLRRAVEHAFRPLEGRYRYQGLFAALHEMSLRGMNYGQATGVAATGESVVVTAVSGMPGADNSPLIVDVGANVGDYAQLVLNVFGDCRVVCIEPSSVAFGQLAQGVGRRPNVEIVNVALGAEPAQLVLYADQPGSSKAALTSRQLPGGGARMTARETVSVDTLDALAERRGWSRVRLLKLDVEGWELPVLRGAAVLLAEERIDVLQFEFGGTQVDSRYFLRDFYELLNGRFRLFRVLRDGVYPMPDWDERAEIFTMTNYVAVRNGLVDPFVAALPRRG